MTVNTCRGEKISPIEVDTVLSEHPAVSAAVSFAVANEHYGQEVEAAVELRQGQQLTQKELQDFVVKRLAPFKVPKRIHFTAEIPRTATGKIQRIKVAEAFQSKSKL